MLEVRPNVVSKKKLCIKTFGCQMNEYDSEKVAMLLAEDYERVEDERLADLVVVNTCSVRDKPEQKLYSLLGQLSLMKRERPSLMVGVGGCVAQQEGERIVKRNRDVDFVYGTHNISLVPSLVSLRARGAPPQVAVDYRDEWETLPPGYSEPNRVSVFVSVSRGCNKNCTYCIVPTTRGREVSRSLDEVLREVRLAAHRGAREVVLLGQTVNSWGLDLTPRRKFPYLVEQVAAVPGIQRIRFTSPHPQEVRKDFIDLMVSEPKICRHIHMPLQSGSDRILKLMNRNYRREKYLNIINALRERIPDIAISTDLIVGFPGEAEEDFEATLDMVRRVGFESSFAFMFSPRPGTVAADEMADDVPEEVKKDRLYRLLALQEELTSGWINRAIGSEQEVLVEGPSANDPAVLTGKNQQNFQVNLLKNGAEVVPGDVVNVRITGRSRFTLRGQVSLSRCSEPRALATM